jgi:hypothetical protein
VPEVSGRLRPQHELARRGQHRLPIPDLVISAAAQSAGLVVLHYDADFERLAAAGGADHGPDAREFGAGVGWSNTSAMARSTA